MSLLTRREFGTLALAAFPAVHLLGSGLQTRGQEQAAKPNSNFGGVNVGIIAPYAFRGTAGNVDDILSAMLKLGLSSVEMQAEPVEAYAGAPARGRGGGGRGRRGGRGRGGETGRAGDQGVTAQAEGAQPPQRQAEGAEGRRGDGAPRRGRGAPPTTEELAARRAAGEEMRKWRLSQSMSKYEELRKKYNDAGVSIDIVKFGLGSAMTDDEVDYCFQVAKALGCEAITCEPPVSETKRLGTFAEKHQIRLGFHNHSNATSVESFCRPGAWEQAFFYSDWNGANVDIGHFCAGNSMSPADFIRSYHNRITNLHLKDRKFNQGPNMPWGEGDTPIREVLQMMKREKYPFMATIELEYPVPEGSEVMTELAKCVQFCKEALA
ncbi:MAG: sugar phosphate isomerase/epimerase [Pirellulales bacterium]